MPYTEWGGDHPMQLAVEEQSTSRFAGNAAAAAEAFQDTVGRLAFEAGMRDGASGANLTDEERVAQGGDAVFGYHMDNETATARLNELGYGNIVVPRNGVNTRALDVMVEREYQQRRRHSTMSRSSAGGVEKFISGIVGSIPDPVNILMLPLAPEAAALRGLGWSAKAGKRAVAGAKQGFAGAAAFEVPHYVLAKGAGDDYRAMDTVLNLTVGTILGAGFHVGGRAISDFRKGPYVEPITPDEIATGVAQFHAGQKIDATAVYEAKVMNQLDDLDARIYEALGDGDRVAARELGQIKRDLIAESGIDPNGRPVKQAAPEPSTKADGDGDVPLEPQGPQGTPESRTKADAKLRDLAAAPSKFLDEASVARVEAEAEWGRLTGEKQKGEWVEIEKAVEGEDLGKGAQPTRERVGPLEATEKAQADAELDVAKRELQEVGGDEAVAKLDSVIEKADIELQDIRSLGKAIRAAAMCNLGRG